MLSGGGGGVDGFTRINSMANVYLLLPGSIFSCVFFANRASMRYACALERGFISPQQCVCGVQTALFSSLQVLQAMKESC